MAEMETPYTFYDILETETSEERILWDASPTLPQYFTSPARGVHGDSNMCGHVSLLNTPEQLVRMEESRIACNEDRTNYLSRNTSIMEWIYKNNSKHQENSIVNITTAGAAHSEDKHQVSNKIPVTRLQRRMLDKTTVLGETQSFKTSANTPQTVTTAKNINVVQIGKLTMSTGYFSSYPDPYGKLKHLFICEYCLSYMESSEKLIAHKSRCMRRAPPGQEVYCDGSISIYEVDGETEREYVRNTVMLAKLFIDSKNADSDIRLFHFYVFCVVDKEGAHFAGCFSKEKWQNLHNLSCIVTLPPFRGIGFGKLMISFSYELSKIQGIVGRPEEPLSICGKAAYQSYWSSTLLETIHDHTHRERLSIDKLSDITRICKQHVTETLKILDMTSYEKGEYVLNINDLQVVRMMRRCKDKMETRFKVPAINPSKIYWMPKNYVKTIRRKVPRYQGCISHKSNKVCIRVDRHNM